MQSNGMSVLCRIRPTEEDQSCVIPCANFKGVIASRSPLSKRRFGSVLDSRTLQSTLKKEGELIQFDNIITEDTKQSEVFEDYLESSVLDMLANRSFTCVVFGPSSSGKSFTLRGGEGKQRGLLLRSVEKLLSVLLIQRTRYEVRVESWGTVQDQHFNLIEARSVRISAISDLHHVLHESLKRRNKLGKVQFTVRINLYKAEALISQADFVEAQDTLDFNSLTKYPLIAICCVNPSCNAYDHTLSVLKYARSLSKQESNAKSLDKAQVKNNLEGYIQHKSEIDNLRKELKKKEKEISELKEEVCYKTNKKGKSEDLEHQKHAEEKDKENQKIIQKLIEKKRNYKAKLKEMLDTQGILLSLHRCQDLSLVPCIKGIIKYISDPSGAIERASKFKLEIIEDLKFDNTYKQDEIVRRLKELKRKLKSHEKAIQNTIEEFPTKTNSPNIQKIIIESHSKDMQIQNLQTEISALEGETSMLTSLVTDYESYIYDLKKANLAYTNDNKHLNFQLQEAGVEVKSLKNMIEKIRENNYFEINKVEQEIKDLKEKSHLSENIHTNSEQLRLELLNSALINNQLIIENNELKGQVEENSKLIRRCDPRFEKIKEILQSLYESNLVNYNYSLEI